jgi:hypothetical protein
MKLTKRRIALTIFGLVFAFTALIEETLIQNIDSERRYEVTKSLTSGAPSVKPEDTINHQYLIGTNGGQYYWYGMGESVFLVPADFIAWQALNLFNPDGDKKENLRRTIVTSLTFPTLAAATVAISFLLLAELNFSLMAALLGALFFFFGTTLLNYSQVHQENSQIIFLVISGYYMLTRWLNQRRWLFLLVGSGLFGTLLLIRITTFADILGAAFFTILVLFWREKLTFTKEIIRRFIQFCLIFGGGVGFFFLLERLYQFKRFGSFTSTYISVLTDQMKAGTFNFGTSFEQDWPYGLSPVTGILNVLFSPEKSIFIYDPLLIVLGITLVIRHFGLNLPGELNLRKAFILSGGLSLVIYLIGYSTIIFWGGDASWGARYHTSPVQLLCLLAVPLFLEIAPQLNRYARVAIKSLIGLVCLFQLCSITFWYTVEINQYICNFGTNFRILQRIDNIILYFTGNFQPIPDCVGLENTNILPFWPFYAAVDVIPRSLLPMIAALWLILLLITGWALVRFMRKAFRQLAKDQTLLPAVRLSEEVAGEIS